MSLFDLADGGIHRIFNNVTTLFEQQRLWDTMWGNSALNLLPARRIFPVA